MIKDKLKSVIASVGAKFRRTNHSNVAPNAPQDPSSDTGSGDAELRNSATQQTSPVTPAGGSSTSELFSPNKSFQDPSRKESTSLALINKGISWFRALSVREKSIVAAGVLVLVIMGVGQAYTPIRETFAQQEEKLAELNRYATAAPAVVERYSRLKARREQLEKRFKEIEFKEGALSYIENLVRQQPGVAPGFDIRESTPKAFGKSFEQQPFLVRFQTTNAAGFVEFLKSVARGERSLLISKLEIQKPRRGDRLEVDLELNTIRQSS